MMAGRCLSVLQPGHAAGRACAPARTAHRPAHRILLDCSFSVPARTRQRSRNRPQQRTERIMVDLGWRAPCEVRRMRRSVHHPRNRASPRIAPDLRRLPAGIITGSASQASLPNRRCRRSRSQRSLRCIDQRRRGSRYRLILSYFPPTGTTSQCSTPASSQCLGMNKSMHTSPSGRPAEGVAERLLERPLRIRSDKERCVSCLATVLTYQLDDDPVRPRPRRQIFGSQLDKRPGPAADLVGKVCCSVLALLPERARSASPRARAGRGRPR